MKTKKNLGLFKSDLLYEHEVKRVIKKIEKVKTWIIYASNGEFELKEPESLELLKDLNYLQLKLKLLKGNLKNGLIKFDNKLAENQ